MQICGLFRKPQVGMPVQSQSHLQLIPGNGIQGDIQAKPGSPRQVLILDRPTLQAVGLQPGDLRENILLDAELHRFASGQGLQIGETLIRLTFRCEPCRFLDSLQPGLTQRLRQQRGWLGMVIQGGPIAIGDTVMLTEQRFPVLSDSAKERFYQFVATIPVGQVVTTADVILALGVTSAHYRTLPGLLKRAPGPLPAHRVIARDRTLLTQHLPHQAEALASEGIEILKGQVPETYNWHPEQFYPIPPMM
jgi:alkylated DNA nucleotide flippase Atl1